MSEKVNTDALRLTDMLKAIEDIEAFSDTSLEDRKTLFAIAYAIAIIGEAASKLSPAFKHQHTHIPWQQISGMRNRIIHEYGKVNITRLQEVISHHIPDLKMNLIEIMEKHNEM